MNTGCSLLEAKGVKPKDKAMIEVSDEDVVRYCEPCRLCKCRLTDMEGREFYYNTAVYHEGREEVYQCIKCGEMETLTFYNGVLEPTRKFAQVGDKIYHVVNCGECRKVR